VARVRLNSVERPWQTQYSILLLLANGNFSHHSPHRLSASVELSRGSATVACIPRCKIVQCIIHRRCWFGHLLVLRCSNHLHTASGNRPYASPCRNHCLLQREAQLPCCAVDLHHGQQSLWLAPVPIAVRDVPAPAEEVHGPHPTAIPPRPTCKDGGITMLLQIAACGPRETHTRCCAIRCGIKRPCTCILQAI
jgi:hypothetical protein